MVALSDDRLLMSAQEYLVWEPTQEERYEYWDGEVVAMSGGTRYHKGSSVWTSVRNIERTEVRTTNSTSIL